MAVPVYDHRPQAEPRVLIDPYAVRNRRGPRGERLDHLFEARCDWVTGGTQGDRLAVDADGLRLTYRELDTRANRLARYLRLRGTRAGDRIGLLLDDPSDAPVAVLGVFKIGAAYVPLHAGTPVERMARVVANARVRTVLSTSATADRVPRAEWLAAGGAELVCLDRVARLVDGLDAGRLVARRRDRRPEAGQVLVQCAHRALRAPRRRRAPPTAGAPPRRRGPAGRAPRTRTRRGCRGRRPPRRALDGARGSSRRG